MTVTLDSVEDLTADQVRIEYITCLTQVLSQAREMLASTVSANTDVAVTVGLTGAILHRMIECATSILILAGQNRSRDMAVLLLNLMELRIDLQYIALSPEREGEWLAHSNEWRKPWKLDKQLKDIYPKQAEWQAEIDMYHLYSMVKHGSPAKGISCLTERMKGTAEVGGAAFSITCDGKKLILDQNDFTHMTGSFLFATGHNIHTATQAVGKILSRRSLSFPAVQEKLASSARTLDAIIKRDCMRKIVQWVKANDPEFARLCGEMKRLTAERDRAAQRMENAQKAREEAETELARMETLAGDGEQEP